MEPGENTRPVLVRQPGLTDDVGKAFMIAWPPGYQSILYYRVTMHSNRSWSLTILILTVLVVGAHVAAAGPWRDSWWGVHMYAFLPTGWLVLALALLGAGQAMWSTRVWSRMFSDEPASPAAVGTPFRRRLLWLSMLSVGGGGLFWLVRVRHLLLGDASVIAVDVPRGGSFLPREPAANWLQQRFYDLGQILFGGSDPAAVDAAGFDLVAQKSVALSSVTAGAVFLPLAWFLAGELAPRRTWHLPLFLALVGQGYLLLFCGYVEHYALPTLALTLYLWLSLRALRTGGSLVLPAAALLLAVGFHLSAAVMVPSFLVLVGYRLADRATRKRGFVELGLSVLLVAVVLVTVAMLARGYSLLHTLTEVTRLALTREQEHDAGYLLSSRHWRDFLNNQALIGPLGLFLFLPAVVVAARRRNARWWFLAAAGLAYATVSWLAGDSNLGYPRNWDLLAPGGLVLTVAGLGLFCGRRDCSKGALAVLWLAVGLSWFHTAPWIALNTSFDRSFERFKILPTEGGLTETNVARWYLMLDDQEAGRRWVRQALVVAPGNNNAWFLLGRSLELEGRPDDAAYAYVRAVALRPDKVGYREGLVRTLVTGARWAEAIDAGRPLATDPAATPEALMWYGVAMYAGGERESASAILKRVRAATTADDRTRRLAGRFFEERGNVALTEDRWLQAAAAYREALTWDAELRDVWLALTYCLREAGDGEEAAAVARQAMRRYPDWSEMLTNLGIVLYDLGRREEARSAIERSLELDPQQTQALQLRGMLER